MKAPTRRISGKVRVIALAVVLLLLASVGSLAANWRNGTPNAVEGTKAPPRTTGATVYSAASGVLFDVNSAALRPDAELALRAIHARIDASGAGGIVRVEGYTDDLGAEAYNDNLSSARAETVAGWLVRHGIARTRVKVYFYGERSPAVPNDTDAHRQTNRRVVIAVEP